MKRHVGGRSAELGSTSLDLLAPVEKVEVDSKHSQDEGLHHTWLHINVPTVNFKYDGGKNYCVDIIDWFAVSVKMIR